MPTFVPPVDDERDALLSYLAQQRDALRLAAYGLTDAQATSAPTRSSLSIAGIVAHLVAVEGFWIDRVLGGRTEDGDGDRDRFPDGSSVADGETLEVLLARYADRAAATESAVSRVADLGDPVPVPHEIPWLPRNVDAWSVRWVLLHLITETARHAGHADLVREQLDGARARPLMAAAEGWPEEGRVRPWRPGSS